MMDNFPFITLLGSQLEDWEEVMSYDLPHVAAGSRPFFHVGR